MENNKGLGLAISANALVLRLPWLRGAPAGEAPLESPARRLWPGHANPPGGWHVPGNYPLSAAQADKFLQDVASCGPEELEGMRQIWAMPENAAWKKNLLEMRDLSNFAAKISCQSGPSLEYELFLLQAQKILLWTWFEEERLAEIAALVQNFAKAAESFANILAEGEEDKPASPGGGFELAAGLLPSWRTVLLNALPFLPQETAILAEGPLRAALLESPMLEGGTWEGLEIRGAVIQLAELAGVDERKLPKPLQRKAFFFTYV